MHKSWLGGGRLLCHEARAKFPEGREGRGVLCPSFIRASPLLTCETICHETMTILSPCETLERSKRSWTIDWILSAAGSLADAPRYLTLAATAAAAATPMTTATAVVKVRLPSSQTEHVYPGPRV